MTPPSRTHYDAVIVGGGHNGLVAAAYLAGAGASVLLLERRPFTGGAAISAQTFPGVDARLSRYSYLLSMFPQRIMKELDLNIEARRRAVASYSPTVRDGIPTALLISNIDQDRCQTSFRNLTGSDAEFDGYRKWYAGVNRFAAKVWDGLLQPLVSRDAMRETFSTPEERAAWDMLIERPLGEGIEAHVQDDITRGAIFTDATIAAVTHPHDPSLLQNRTYLFHTIGNMTGEWRVPIGGMGHVTDEIARRARVSGAEIITDARVTAIHPDHVSEVVYTDSDGVEQRVSAAYVLVNAAPNRLAKLVGDDTYTDDVEGSSFKINMVLRRLPRLAMDGIDPREAFAGTFHVDEGYAALTAGYHAAERGEMPDPMPGEIYCHTLTDESILSPELATAGYHTLTLFGVNAPYRLYEDDNAAQRAETVRRYLRQINRALAEPIEDCLALDANGQPCIEAKSPVDLENELELPKGHIFHKAMTWVFADDPAQVGTWGVETRWSNVFICGSGAARGGCVSGIPGHNAAMKTLECLGKPIKK